jgi:hypothetical protein
VLIAAGSYSEDVSLTVPGIHLLGQMPQNPPDTTFGGRNTVVNSGKLSVSFGVPSTYHTIVQGIDWVVDGLCLEMDGALKSQLMLRECLFGPGVFLGSVDATCVNLTNTSSDSLVVFSDCVIANFGTGTSTSPLVETTVFVDMLRTTVAAGFIGDGFSIRAYGTTFSNSVFLSNCVVSGTIKADQKSRFITDSDTFLGGSIFPTAFNGVFVNNVSTVEGDTQNIFEDTTFSINGSTALFDGTGGSSINYGAKIIVYNGFGAADVLKSDWKEATSGPFAVLPQPQPHVWSMEHTSYEPTTSADWAGDPATLLEAVDRLAAAYAASHAPVP